jgi:hypothetical protein
MPDLNDTGALKAMVAFREGEGELDPLSGMDQDALITFMHDHGSPVNDQHAQLVLLSSRYLLPHCGEDQQKRCLDTINAARAKLLLRINANMINEQAAQQVGGWLWLGVGCGMGNALIPAGMHVRGA